MEQFVTGILSISHSGVGFVNTSDNKTILIKQKDLGYGLPRETVQVRVCQDGYGRIESPPSFLGKSFLGFVHHYYMDQVIIFSPILGKRFMIYVNTSVPLSIHDRVIVDILTIEDTKIIGKINPNYEICSLFSEEKDDTMIQAAFDLKDDLFDKVQKKIEDYPIHVERVDLTFLKTFTIDPKGSKDLDDAISVDYREHGMHLMVHIADVSEFIYPGSKYWDQAIKNGSTFYGKERNWTMLPRHYADEICSIREYKITHVITNEFFIPYLNFFGVLDINHIQYLGYYYSTIQSSKQFTYEEVERIIDRKTYFEDYYQIFIHISQITTQLKKSFNSINMCLEKKSGTKSHEMIEVLMLWVNHVMSQKLNGFGIFRNHPAPFENQQNMFNKIMQSSSTCRENLISFTKTASSSYSSTKIKTFEFLLKDMMRKAVYDKEPVFHFALGFDSYIHFTSPIRRAADLINHCILKGYRFTDEQLTEYLQMINEADVKQLKIEETLRFFCFLRELFTKEKEVFQAVIIDVTKAGIRIFLPKIEHTCYIHISKLSDEKLFLDLNTLSNSSNKYSLLDEIHVKLDKMDYDINKISWSLA